MKKQFEIRHAQIIETKTEHDEDSLCSPRQYLKQRILSKVGSPQIKKRVSMDEDDVTDNDDYNKMLDEESDNYI